MMDDAFGAVLATYNARAAEEEEVQKRSVSSEQRLQQRDRYLLHVGEEVARFLHSLIIARKAKRVLELGTSYGYSTLFLADAVRATGGRLITLELSPDKQEHARSQLGRAGLAQHVDWLQGDAIDLLANLDGPFDFVLLDLWKELYIPCLDLFLPKLADGAIVAADNMLFPEIVRPEAEAYRAAVRGKPALQSVLLPIGQGIELSCYWPDQRV